MKKIKKGLGLSVELVVVLVVMVAMLAFVLAGIPYLMRMSRMHSMANEVSNVKNSIGSFMTTIGYWPGDVPISELSLTMKSIEADYNAICTNPTSSDCILGNKLIGAKKSILANRELALSKIDTAYDSIDTSALGSAITYSSSMFIKSSYGKGNIYGIFSDKKMATGQVYSYKNSFTQNDANLDTLSSSLKVVLFNYNNIPTFGTEGLSAVDFTTGIASVSASDMSTLDAKIDDGLPGTGFVMAEGASVAPTTAGGAVTEYANALCTITYATYAKSSKVGGMTGCIPTIIVKELGSDE